MATPNRLARPGRELQPAAPPCPVRLAGGWFCGSASISPPPPTPAAPAPMGPCRQPPGRSRYLRPRSSVTDSPDRISSDQPLTGPITRHPGPPARLGPSGLPSGVTARKRSFTPPGVSVAQVRFARSSAAGSRPAPGPRPRPAESRSGRPGPPPARPGTRARPGGRSARRSAPRTGSPWPPVPAGTPARISSARASGSKPSITNAFATASRLNGTPGSGRPRCAALSGASIERRNASGSSRVIGTRYVARFRPPHPAPGSPLACGGYCSGYLRMA